ncbi:MAG: ATP-binding protein [Candidatus Omnitrophica bacterium]|nr:ATP-binding protein [Candidatus Omnitrophota bacterium]
MASFFKSQFDYIYFFYGLGFLFLALICFSLARDKSRRLPWFFLGMFGLIHGMNEWVEIYTVSIGNRNITPAISVIALFFSYVFLFEFARRSFLKLYKKENGLLWLYPVFVALSFLGIRYGVNGLNATIRYFLGLPSGLACAWVFFRASRLERKERNSLIALGIIFIFYGLSTGLIVPHVDFLVARSINVDSFYQVCGFPIQLVRGMLALSLAIALWLYPQTLSGIPEHPQKYILPFKPSKWLILVTLAGLIAAGWFFTNYLDYYAGIQIIKNSKANKNSSLNQLIRELTKLEQAAISISRSSAARVVLISGGAQDMERALTLLERYRVSANALDCFLVDTKGILVISTDREFTQAVLNKAYFYREIFKQTRAGETGYYFTFGSTPNDRIYYVGYPVKEVTGKPAGLVIIKKNIPIKPILQYRLFSISITLFVCTLVIILFIALRRRENFIERIEEANRQLQELNKMKTDFISIVSHELRTPLTSIKNAVSILLDSSRKGVGIPQEKELLEIVLNNTNRQTRMISDLLDVSKIEAGVFEIDIAQRDIVSLAREVVAAFLPVAAEKKLTLIVTPEKDSMTAFFDVEQTRRVFANLISNGIKFTPDYGQIKVKLEHISDEIKITVSDSGIGIPPDEIKKIFGKFYRIPDSRVRQISGSGLGLAIAKRLIETQGGSIWAESESGKGSTFYFTLPTTHKVKKERT